MFIEDVRNDNSSFLNFSLFHNILILSYHLYLSISLLNLIPSFYHSPTPPTFSLLYLVHLVFFILLEFSFSLLQKAMEKIGLLIVKETNGVASVISVQRVHDLFKGIKVQNPENLRRSTGGTLGREDEEKKRKDGKVAVLELYKMPKKMRYSDINNTMIFYYR